MSTWMEMYVHTYKVRLVENDYKQRKGVDFDETVSSIAILKSIRIFLAMTTRYGKRMSKLHSLMGHDPMVLNLKMLTSYASLTFPF